MAASQSIGLLGTLDEALSKCWNKIITEAQTLVRQSQENIFLTQENIKGEGSSFSWGCYRPEFTELLIPTPRIARAKAKRHHKVGSWANILAH